MRDTVSRGFGEIEVHWHHNHPNGAGFEAELQFALQEFNYKAYKELAENNLIVDEDIVVDYSFEHSELAASVAAGGFTSVSIPAASLELPDLKGVRAFTVSSGSTNPNNASLALLLPQYTEYDGTNIYFVFTGAVDATNVPKTDGGGARPVRCDGVGPIDE